MTKLRVYGRIAIAMMIAITIVSGNGHAQDGEQEKTPVRQAPRITLTVKDSTVGYIVRSIAEQGKRMIVCDIDHPLFARRISVDIRNTSVTEAYTVALQGTGLDFETAPDGSTILVFPRGEGNTIKTNKPRATGGLRGRVTDSATTKGVEGVTVTVIGTPFTVTTQANGMFVIPEIPSGNYQVSLKRLGYKSEIVSVRIDSRKSATLHVLLRPATTTLSEVVTTAAGNQERIKVGNDIAKINVPDVLKNAPVTTVSELLTNRVPGVIVQKTSGAPGAPSVIRIRGVSSLSLNNDPIIILDGVRVYSTVTDPSDDSPIPGGSAPSVLDGIDLNSVETIEVMRGPSAAALYGTDAANGIIVITTKRGTAGPPQWRISTQQGINYMPGKYPLLRRLWGRNAEGTPTQCAMIARVKSPCVAYDSLISFQILNDKRTTLFGRGSMQNYSFSVDGGAQSLQYSFTISTGSTIGYEKLPDSETERLERLTGLRIPDWQRRPNRLSQISGTSRVGIAFNSNADISLTSSISRQEVNTTPLVNAIGSFFRSPDPLDSLTTVNRVPHFRMRGEAQSVNARFALNGQWRPAPRITLSGDLGWDRTGRDDRSLLRRGDCPTCGFFVEAGVTASNLGSFKSLKGTDDVISFNGRTSLNWLNWRYLSGPTTLGINYTQSDKGQVTINAEELAVGANSFIGANDITPGIVTNDARVAGVYIDQRIGLFNKFYTGFGLRMDAGSGIGTNASPPTFPKLDFSIPIITGENAWNSITMLRIRTAFGHSGRQPSITSRLRTFKPEQIAFDETADGIGMSTIGNTRLRPERSVELEGGVDVGLWSDRIELGVTAYRKMTRDLLISIDVPPSVHGGYSQERNIGDVVNIGGDASLVGRILDRPDVQWTIRGAVYVNRNKLVRVNQDMKGTPDVGVSASGGLGGKSMNVVGYPLNGFWYRPLVSFGDENGDGVLSISELRFADSAVYLGSNQPKFDGSFGTSLGFYRGRVRVNAAFNYQYGQFQRWTGFMSNMGDISSSMQQHPVASDTLASMYNRAMVLSNAAFANTLSTLRWNDLSVSLVVPKRITQTLRVSSATVALQGQNLALWTNYSGIDPNVRDRRGELAYDNNALPPARSWILRIDISR